MVFCRSLRKIVMSLDKKVAKLPWNIRVKSAQNSLVVGLEFGSWKGREFINKTKWKTQIYPYDQIQSCWGWVQVLSVLGYLCFFNVLRPCLCPKWWHFLSVFFKFKLHAPDWLVSQIKQLHWWGYFYHLWLQ